MEKRRRFKQAYPKAFFLENNVQKAANYLQQQKWLGTNEKVLSLEKPGEGNMNFVLRVITNQRSFIIKQARPWVEKYPQIDAPIERVAVEAIFYKSLQSVRTIKQYTPKYLHFDSQNFILAIEDLGKGADFSFLYQKDYQLSDNTIQQLTEYLSSLHQLPIPANFLANFAMRQLNHEHIFNFPYLVENGLNLEDFQEGLQAAAMPYKTNEPLKKVIHGCGKIYLSKNGQHLLHGDFYPGSWLNVADNLKVIDPEFGFVGPAEFDLGVLLAHLMMAEQSMNTIKKIYNNYQQPASFNNKLLAQYTGIEILRRLIGIAQLPLSLDLAAKKRLMQKAANWIISGDLDMIEA